MAVKFCTIASGSSGNCIYVGTKYTNILIDAGVSGRKIEAGLREIGAEGSDIDALFITHEHRDHIQGAGILSRRFNTPVYATPGTWDEMAGCIGDIATKNKKYVYSGENCIINDICVKPFSIPHDAVEPVGYSFMTENIKISLATDIGHITDSIIQSISDSNVLLLESNHDIDMLKNGTYQYHLKKRILGPNGHLSNADAGRLIVSLMNERLRHVFLGHLSRENNTPKMAYQTVKQILRENDITVGTYLNLDVAESYGVTNLLEIGH